ncbi:MAG: DrmB family protein [Desulfuromonadaceae bacterium]
MKELIPVRLSHLLRHCSVGAVVRGSEYLMTVKDIREWTDKHGVNASRPIPYVERVRSALGIDQELREPPLAREREKGKGIVDGVCIPAIRFPFWMKCPTCGLLHYKPWKRLEDNEKPRCCETDLIKCPKSPLLEQVPWIMVHVNGYMADLPWHYLAHYEATSPNQKQCKADLRELYLRLKEYPNSSSKRELRCERCNAQAYFNDRADLPFGRTSQQPWLKSDPDESVEELAEIMEINDTRVHFPITDNALVIPPESRIRKGTIVDRLYCSSENRRQIEQARNDLARKSAFKTLATHFRCTPTEVESAWAEIFNGRYPLQNVSITSGQLMEDEYRALVDEISDLYDDEDFVARHKTVSWKKLGDQFTPDTRSHLIVRSVSRLIAVTRLKEIQVLKGFCRVDDNSKNLVPPDIDGSSGWLPAIELYGEGIFITLDEAALAKWESLPSIKNRAGVFSARFEHTGMKFENEFIVTPRFLLLHTISHILIRQFETQAGYPAASLTERIYCKSGKNAMSGILIYVAVPDIVGSLGGLAELADPVRMLTLLNSLFEHAEWCSFDPVCSEHDGQGLKLLNRAACHACALVPEPSCAYGNVLLDRTFIKGNIRENIPGFLQQIELVGKGYE